MTDAAGSCLQAALEKEPEPNGAGARLSQAKSQQGRPSLRASSFLGVMEAGSRKGGKALVQSKKGERERHTSLQKMTKGPV